MKIIGFNFTKIFAERARPEQGHSLSTNIEFTNVEKDTIELLKDLDAIKVSFKYSISFSDPNSKKEEKSKKEDQKEEKTPLFLEGLIVLSATKEESKDVLKFWKKKQLPPPFNVALFNAILRKCTPKAIQLEDELDLPSHIPIPQITPKKEN